MWADQGEARDSLLKKVDELKQKSTEALKEQGFDETSIVFEEYLNMRYRGTESALMIVKPQKEFSFGDAFTKQHEQEFGFTFERDILVDDVRVRAIGKSVQDLGRTVDQQLKTIRPKEIQGTTKEYKRAMVYFDGSRQDTPIHTLESLDVGDNIKGPAILCDGTQTIVLPPNSSALIIDTHVVINISDNELGSSS